MNILLHPTYFPNIATFAVIVKHDIVWEVHDNYQKQTFRNRTYICTDRGKHILNIPIQHVGGSQGRQKYQDVKLKNDYPWQRQHIRTLQTAYRTSPFFEFYEDDIVPFFERPHKFLLDINFKALELISKLLEIDISDRKTESYQTNIQNIVDGRFLINAKQELNWEQKKYTQVFEERHGFIQNNSILDLLFNEGPNTLTYLKSQPLSFLNL